MLDIADQRIASTSSVVRGPAAASSVIRRPVTLPPTKTSSPSSGRRRRAAMINCSRFESFIGFSEPTAQLGLSSFSFTSAAVPQGVGEGQVLVKRRVAQGRDGGGLVQRLKRDAPLLALLVRPNGTRLVPLRDNTAERLSGVRCRNPAGEFAPFGRKNVLQPVEEEFFERATIGNAEDVVRQAAGCYYPAPLLVVCGAQINHYRA